MSRQVEHKHPPSSPLQSDALRAKSNRYRKNLLTFIYETGAGHTGGSLSCVDIVNVLYNAVMDITPENWHTLERDHYIHSKGHSVEALYVVLADLGFFPREELRTGGKFQSRLIGHPTRKVPGVEQNTGGLGHGLSFAVGLAIAAKMDGRVSNVYCLMGDGELAEGSNWEAAMTAAHYGLDNLIGIIDRNKLQITGHTKDVMRLEPLVDKWGAFGWEVAQVDGHDVEQLESRLDATPYAEGKPSLLIAHTVKGKGFAFAEDQAEWHHKAPTEEQYRKAMAELQIGKNSAGQKESKSSRPKSS